MEEPLLVGVAVEAVAEPLGHGGLHLDADDGPSGAVRVLECALQVVAVVVLVLEGGGQRVEAVLVVAGALEVGQATEEVEEGLSQEEPAQEDQE